MEINVIKNSGEIEPLDLKKIRNACLRSGASQIIVNNVIHEIQVFLYDGITTKEIYQRVRGLLRKYSVYSEIRFRLKEAMINMGPSGFPFESYFTKILKHYGYNTKSGIVLHGACIDHEIDIIAEDFRKEKYMIECKYHNAFGIYSGLKDILYTYARFLDLKDGYEKGMCEHLDNVWFVTNTKISNNAVKYGECKSIKLLGWAYPLNNGLEEIIKQKNLYPITVLEFIDKKTLNKFYKAGIILIKDLEIYSIKQLSEVTEISRNKLEEIIRIYKTLNNSN